MPAGEGENSNKKRMDRHERHVEYHPMNMGGRTSLCQKGKNPPDKRGGRTVSYASTSIHHQPPLRMRRGEDPENRGGAEATEEQISLEAETLENLEDRRLLSRKKGKSRTCGGEGYKRPEEKYN